ncbi:hypothetical protein LWI28_011819 [Acer negundo]|uniref:Uncharacterized protein n=1 Tax=Acer negundo TaxID=4023 RepID=A0AAD5J4C1_ACENE|nr:hypothetical protein LWI28_011819 [Acer negundo]
MSKEKAKDDGEKGVVIEVPITTKFSDSGNEEIQQEVVPTVNLKVVEGFSTFHAIVVAFASLYLLLLSDLFKEDYHDELIINRTSAVSETIFGICLAGILRYGCISFLCRCGLATLKNHCPFYTCSEECFFYRFLNLRHLVIV